MASKRTDHSTDPTPNPVQPHKRKTIPASKVGVTLTISNKALEEIDRIQEESIKAAQEAQKFSWQ